MLSMSSFAGEAKGFARDMLQAQHLEGMDFHAGTLSNVSSMMGGTSSGMRNLSHAASKWPHNTCSIGAELVSKNNFHRSDPPAGV